jgi:uncharacterized protein with PIN domain
MKFICDDNLGKLAKWLRTLGYDTLFFDPIEDGDLIARGLKEDRAVLSRDTQLSRFKPKLGERLIFIQSDKPLEQLKQVLEYLKLKPNKELLFSLCLLCNEPLEDVKKEEIKDKLYPYVYRTYNQFSRCPKCNRIYWPATHVDRMREKLSKAQIT